MSSTRDALEAALAAHPDDVAAHAAYADLLIEDDDPRGEFIQLQLAAEDRNQPADRLRSLEQQAYAVRNAHERGWLGPLAPHVFPARRVRSVDDMVSANVEVTWRRGWVHGVRVGQLHDETLAALAEAPVARLLQELEVRSNAHAVGWRRQSPTFVSLTPLARSANVRNLRKLVLGSDETWQAAHFGGDVADLVKKTRRLEHLQIAAQGFVPARVFGAKMPRLHTLHVTTNDHRLPIAILGVNKSLTNLARLHLDLVAYMPADPAEPGAAREPLTPSDFAMFFGSKYLTGLRYLALRLPGFADAGVEALLASEMIGRLRGLDLCRCEITDDGAQMLARWPGVADLEYLHLDNNMLSPVGIEALAEAGVQVSDRQFFGGGWDEPDYDDGPNAGGGIPF